jgi:3-methyladenine DNA glycosylase AlkD
MATRTATRTAAAATVVAGAASPAGPNEAGSVASPAPASVSSADSSAGPVSAAAGAGATAPAGAAAAGSATAATAGSGATAPAGAATAGSATAAARVLVAERLPIARRMGADLAAEVDEPAAFVASTRRNLALLADPAYHAGQRLVAPGIGLTLGVRTPLVDGVLTGLRRGVRGVRPARLLGVADALARDEVRELRWMAIGILRWILPDDPERAWQVIRRIGRDADDWITVDTLAGTAAAGILREPYRWAELEQLVFSPIRWERRLVGSTIANVPHVGHPLGRTDAVVARGLDLLGQLIGDAEPDVQKSLSWALRELAKVAPEPVVAFCRVEADRAAVDGDGHRAWVVRDTLAKLPLDEAEPLRVRLAGIRRLPGAPSTSRAAATAVAFASSGLGRPLPEVPLT